MASETPRIQFATASDGVRIAYAVIGTGAPLVLLPGWTSHLELQWAGLQGDFNRWLARQHQVVVYDGRGTGLSDRNVNDLSVDARLRDRLVRGCQHTRFHVLHGRPWDIALPKCGNLPRWGSPAENRG